MTEVRFNIRPYGVKYMCECDNEMIYTGQMLMTDPPKFVHICKECGRKENLQEKFPTVRWENITE